MKSDIKELLDLAAKACGYKNLGYTANGLKVPNPVLACGFDYWSPHLDDGDGARMEADLYIEPAWGDEVAVARTWGHGLIEVELSEPYADHNGNRQAARLMASLRVAAEIGRRMK